MRRRTTVPHFIQTPQEPATRFDRSTKSYTKLWFHMDMEVIEGVRLSNVTMMQNITWRPRLSNSTVKS